VGGAGRADGEAGVQQGGDMRVLSGTAVVEGGPGDLNGLAVASLQPGLHGEVGPRAGGGGGVRGEQGALQGGGVEQGGLLGVAAVVAGPTGGRVQVADRAVQGALDAVAIGAAVEGLAQPEKTWASMRPMRSWTRLTSLIDNRPVMGVWSMPSTAATVVAVDAVMNLRRCTAGSSSCCCAGRGGRERLALALPRGTNPSAWGPDDRRSVPVAEGT
jgi:hypothetical protein